MSYKIERVCESVHLGEGPHWDVESQSLYYVDIHGSDIHKYTPATGSHSKAHIGGGRVSIIIPIKDAPNKYLITIGGSLAVITWDGSDKVEKIEKIATLDSDPKNRLNDGKADPAGRIFTGSMQSEEETTFFEKKGHFYSYEKGGKITKFFSEVSISNGLAWNADATKFYYTDSLAMTLDQFDYDVKTGLISNRTPIFTPKKHGVEGILDGHTIDADGNLWCAMFQGGCVIKIDPRKPETLLEVVKLPAHQITSVAFGGVNLDELYVTSGKLKSEGMVLDPPVHGATYRITGLGVKGLPAIKADI